MARGLTFSWTIQPGPMASPGPGSFFSFAHCGSSCLLLSLLYLAPSSFSLSPLILLSCSLSCRCSSSVSSSSFFPETPRESFFSLSPFSPFTRRRWFPHLSGFLLTRVYSRRIGIGRSLRARSLSRYDVPGTSFRRSLPPLYLA